MKRKRTSIAHVAEQAGVSAMTVSRVLRGEASVKPETRARVVEAMRAMGYVPLAAAQSLRSKNHLTQSGARLFALIFGRGTESSVTFFHDIVRGVERSASEFGLCPIHVTLQENPHDSWLRLQTVLTISSLCGALLVGEFSEEDVYFVRDRARNVVIVDGPAPKGDRIGSVESGNLEGSLMAMDYLIQIGCRDILVLTVDREHYFARSMAAAAAARRSKHVQVEVLYDCLTSQDARDMLVEQWQSGRRCDGIFTNDDFAVGALKALSELGVSVPEEVRIVGFDDILYASFAIPSLSSIRIDKYLLGAEAVRSLVALIESPERAAIIKKTIQPSLMVRDSTGGVPVVPVPAGGPSARSISRAAATGPPSARAVEKKVDGSKAVGL
ncbi:MAG: LacI family DNA-binding transcriptional regulator [Spirochaetales bacterium]|nr:LacI family DNA-binding transcriptional regulator [Spirochaetales bacterium]